jgi:hypothetical protein
LKVGGVVLVMTGGAGALRAGPLAALPARSDAHHIDAAHFGSLNKNRSQRALNWKIARFPLGVFANNGLVQHASHTTRAPQRATAATIEGAASTVLSANLQIPDREEGAE